MADFSDFQIELTRGDTYKFSFVVQIGGIPQGIASWQKFWFTAKTNPAATTAVIALTDLTGGGIERVAPQSGGCEVTIPATATASLPNRRQMLYADIQGEDASGREYTLAKGTVVVSPEITTATS